MKLIKEKAGKIHKKVICKLRQAKSDLITSRFNPRTHPIVV